MLCEHFSKLLFCFHVGFWKQRLFPGMHSNIGQNYSDQSSWACTTDNYGSVARSVVRKCGINWRRDAPHRPNKKRGHGLQCTVEFFKGSSHLLIVLCESSQGAYGIDACTVTWFYLVANGVAVNLPDFGAGSVDSFPTQRLWKWGSPTEWLSVRCDWLTTLPGCGPPFSHSLLGKAWTQSWPRGGKVLVKMDACFVV